MRGSSQLVALLATLAGFNARAAPPERTSADTVPAAARGVGAPVAGGAASTGRDRIAGDRFDLARPAGEKRRFWATQYRIQVAREARDGVPLLGKDGGRVGPSLAPGDWCAAAIEGTLRAILENGPPVLLNHAGLAGVSLVDRHGAHRQARPLSTGRRCSPHVRERKQAEWIPQLGRTRFRPALGPYGDGASRPDVKDQSYVLVPFRTVAVEPPA